MPCRLLWIAAALVALAATPCTAQIAANPAARNALLLVQLDINGGQLHAKARHQGRTTSSFSSSGRQRTERLKVELKGTDPRIEYNVTTPSERVTMVVSNGFDFYVRQEPLGEGSATLPLTFTQQPQGDLTLTWGKTDATRRVIAPTLWHLYLAEPAVCRDHLLPLLELLRPDWRLAETADRIVAALVSSSVLDAPLPWQQWRELVVDLGADEFAVRRAADRQLRSAGPAVRSFLENYDTRQLDAEQRHRVRAILRVLARRSDNTSPEAIASWLSTDPRVWLAMLSDENQGQRQIAKDRLARLLDRPIQFDPAADAPARQSQLEALKEQISEDLGPSAKDDADRN